MTPDEAVVIVTEAATLGIHVSPADPGHLTDMANGWAEVCRDVPYDFAHQVLIDWTGPYHIRPSQVRGTWEQDVRSKQRAGVLIVEGACAWVRVCRCSTDCFNGQLREAEEKSHHHRRAEGRDPSLHRRRPLVPPVLGCPQHRPG